MSRDRSRGLLIVGGLVIAAVIVGLGVDRDDESGEPHDPRSHAPDGASALVSLLDELGADVELGAALPEGEDDVALLLRDQLNDDQREDLVDWARDGGVLVVLDSGSPLRPSQSEDPFFGLDPDQVDPGFCTIDALRDVGVIAPGDTSGLDVGGLEAETCFGDGQIAFVAAQQEDDGTLVATGGPEFALNNRLDERDNSVLAAALLAPTGREQVQFVEAVAPIGGGDETLVELVPDGVWRALAQLGLAFVIYALWRAIRFGRPVAEPQPVAIAGSELVEATGRLLQRTLDPGRAAEVVRADLRLAVARRLGVPRRAGIDGLVDATSARTGVGEAQARLALGDAPVISDADLVAVTDAAAKVREEVLR